MPVFRLRVAPRRPVEQGVQSGTEPLSLLGQPVIYLGWDLRIYRSLNDAVGFQSPQLLNKHLLGNLRDGPFPFRKTHDAIGEQIHDDQQLPSALDFHPTSLFFLSGNQK